MAILNNSNSTIEQRKAVGVARGAVQGVMRAGKKAVNTAESLVSNAISFALKFVGVEIPAPIINLAIKAVVTILVIIVVAIVLILLYVVIVFGGLFNSVTRMSTINPNFDMSRADDIDYIIEAINDGSIDISTQTTGAISEKDFLFALETISNEEKEREKGASITYEIEHWKLLSSAASEISKQEDYDDFVSSNGNTWRYSESTESDEIIINRSDISIDSMDDCQTRWQPIIALMILRTQNEASHWGTYNNSDFDVSLDDVSEYFITRDMIRECYECFDYDISYYYDPIEVMRDKEYIEMSDMRNQSYFYVDERDNEDVTEAIVYKQPAMAPHSIRGPYCDITYVTSDGVINAATVKYHYEDWKDSLTAAAGGYFDENEFLFILSLLPATEDLSEEYREIFENAKEDSDESYTYSDFKCCGVTVPETIFDIIDGYLTKHVIDTIPVGQSKRIDMTSGYICQKDYKNIRGNGGAKGNDTIAGYGCIDCCYMMCANYFNKIQCNPVKICSLNWDGGYVNANEQFEYGNFCTSYKMSYSQKDKMKVSSIVSWIDKGNPIIVHIGGPWRDSNGYWYYQGKGHYFVIYGYDEAGLYVLDPWFSDRDHISYDAYECLRVGGGGMVVVGSTDSSHIAEFKN